MNWCKFGIRRSWRNISYEISPLTAVPLGRQSTTAPFAVSKTRAIILAETNEQPNGIRVSTELSSEWSQLISTMEQSLNLEGESR